MADKVYATVGQRATVAVVRRNIGEQCVVVVPHQECDKGRNHRAELSVIKGLISRKKTSKLQSLCSCRWGRIPTSTDVLLTSDVVKILALVS